MVKSELLVRNGTSSTPGSFGTRARPSTSRKMRGALTSSSPTRSVSGASNPRVALNHRAARHAAQPLLDASARALGYCGGSLLDASKVDPDGTFEHHAVFRGATREVCRVRARYHGLRRRAARVHARAAEATSSISATFMPAPVSRSVKGGPA